ncbi:MAG: hypothetical protein QXU98_10175 [Candidatus Parvarchaeota archaeon]
MEREDVIRVIEKAKRIDKSALLINKMIVEFREMVIKYDKAFVSFYSKNDNKLLLLAWYDYINNIEVI